MANRMLLSLTIVSLASLTAGAGLSAFFSDSTASAGNLFAAGTLDLRLDGQQSLGAFVGGSDLMPGDSVTGSVTVSNAGTLGGALVDLDIAVDATAQRGADGVGRLARFLQVDATYGGTPLAIADENGNGHPDLEDWDRSNVGTRDLPDPGAGTVLAVTVTFDPAAGNDLQGDVATLTFRFLLAQNLGSDLAQDAPAGLAEWTKLPSMPHARNHARAGAVDGVVLVAGGHDGASDTATLQAFDAATASWTTRAPMPAGRYGGAAAVLDGRLYFAGGWSTASGLPSTNLWSYDPAADTWAAHAGLPMLSACGGAAEIDGRLYVTTACDGWSGYRSFLHRYDPATDAWTQLANSPEAHGSPVVGAIGGKLYVVGGIGAGDVAGARLDVYDPATGAWSTLAPMPAARETPMGGVIDGKLWVAGGSDGTTHRAEVFVYDPATDAWTTETSLPAARSGAASTVLGDVLYVAGGAPGTTSDVLALLP